MRRGPTTCSNLPACGNEPGFSVRHIGHGTIVNSAGGEFRGHHFRSAVLEPITTPRES